MHHIYFISNSIKCQLLKSGYGGLTENCIFFVIYLIYFVTFGNNSIAQKSTVQYMHSAEFYL